MSIMPSCRFRVVVSALFPHPSTRDTKSRKVEGDMQNAKRCQRPRFCFKEEAIQVNKFQSATCVAETLNLACLAQPHVLSPLASVTMEDLVHGKRACERARKRRPHLVAKNGHGDVAEMSKQNLNKQVLATKPLSHSIVLAS